jgi:hypothetical protein
MLARGLGVLIGGCGMLLTLCMVALAMMFGCSAMGFSGILVMFGCFIVFVFGHLQCSGCELGMPAHLHIDTIGLGEQCQMMHSNPAHTQQA